jgi:hypothetical protein
MRDQGRLIAFKPMGEHVGEIAMRYPRAGFAIPSLKMSTPQFD